MLSQSTKKQVSRREEQALIDEFNDFVMMIAPKDWSNEARVAYNKLARRLEKAQ